MFGRDRAALEPTGSQVHELRDPEPNLPPLVKVSARDQVQLDSRGRETWIELELFCERAPGGGLSKRYWMRAGGGPIQPVADDHRNDTVTPIGRPMGAGRRFGSDPAGNRR
jgi:hypothetical protein